MGSCVSSHKDASRDSAMKVKLASFGYKTENKPTVADVVLERHPSPSRSVSSFRDFGSKEETFFDSQPWLESDCEDDFYSVIGEFTPSRGSTPVHHSFSKGTLPNGHISSPIPKPSPTDRKKKLAELFEESVRGAKDLDDQNAPEKQNLVNGYQTTQNFSSKSANTTPDISRANSMCSSERTANGDCITAKNKPIDSAQCCLPGFTLCRSYSERKKMSPAVAANGASLAT